MRSGLPEFSPLIAGAIATVGLVPQYFSSMRAHRGDDTYYFLGRPGPPPAGGGGPSIELLQPSLTEVQWRSALEAMAVVEKVRRGFNVHLRIAFEDFDDEVRSFRQSLLEAPNPDSTLKLRLVNKALVFSVALRMYEEHVRSAVSRHWGKNSEEVRFCGEAFSEVFDQSFAYRVVHALRNALVHSDAELVTVRFSTYLTDPDAADSGSASEVVVGLSRDWFAQTDVRAATRREVSALDSDPDLLDLSREALLAVETLDVKLEHVLHPEVDRATALLWALAKDHFPDTAQAPVFMEVNREMTPVGYLSVSPIIWDYIVRRGAHALAAQP